MSHDFTDAELEAFLDEALDPNRAAQVEQAMRDDEELLHRLSYINGRRDAGMHTIGEIWRRNQIGIPSTEELGKYLLGILTDEQADYIRFRIETLKCPYTIAGLNDLRQRQADPEDKTESRRQKYYKSSAGLLKPNPDEQE